jgi:D-alanine-D-alanine ligase
MCSRVAIVYNEPNPSRYSRTGEEKAVIGVLEAVISVHESLVKLGHNTQIFPLVTPFASARKKLVNLEVDLVFNLFEGFCGQPQTEALVPETLARLGIPFTGCCAPTLKIALDKAGVKSRLREAGFATANYQLLTPDNLMTFCLDYPCIVKPRGEDASHGITAASFVTDFASLGRQVKIVTSSYGGSALVERFIGGREFNATVMGNRECTVLPVSEIVYSLSPGIPRILSFEAKWEPESAYYEGTRVVCPAEVGSADREAIAGTALAAYKLLGCRGYARVDMRMDESNRLNVMEINPNPDISPGTGAARQALAGGMDYTQFINKIVELALEKRDDGCPSPSHGRRRQTGADANTPEYTRV